MIQVTSAPLTARRSSANPVPTPVSTPISTPMLASPVAVDDLLRRILRRAWATDEPALPDQFSEPTWRALADRARETGLSAALGAAILREGLPAPQWCLAALTQDRMRVAARNGWYQASLHRVLVGLAEADVPVILLKGAALNAAVYGDLSQRPMRDIDLLVAPSDAATALGVLRAAGFSRVERATVTHPELVLRGGWDDLDWEALVAAETQVGLTQAEAPGLTIDLHWQLLDRPFYRDKAPFERLLASAEPVHIGGAPAWILGREDWIQHLCAHHSILHPEEESLTIRWRFDLAQLILQEADSINWGLLLTETQWRELVLAMQRSLPVVAREWSLDLPAPVLEALAEIAPGSGEKAAMACYTGNLRSSWRRRVFDFVRLPSWRLRARLVWRLIVPSRGYMAERYAEVSAWRRYPHRWWLGLRSVMLASPPDAPTPDASRQPLLGGLPIAADAPKPLARHKHL